MVHELPPPDPRSSPWLYLAAPLGKLGAAFVIVSAFAAMFAPIVFLLDAEAILDPRLPSSSLIAIFADPARVLAISDFLAIIGVVLLTSSMALILLALVRGDHPVSVLTYLIGAIVLACLAFWVPVMLFAQGAARGTISTVDAAAATGGWSIASFLLLIASVAYLVFTLRVEYGVRPRKLTSFWWPVYGAFNVVGSVAVSSFFAGVEAGTGSAESLSLGLVLKVTLIPMLGVMAYGDLKDRFPKWANVPLMEPVAPSVPAVVAEPTRVRQADHAMPPLVEVVPHRRTIAPRILPLAKERAEETVAEDDEVTRESETPVP